ncbi:uncharacterized protein METZ01_LOCUS169136 [marine metagenome]|uniref:Uncharacterized protein n=1 Tax=marine metagenome TaxID=408172 RepID=A0A382BS76_9ZZZZ
MFIISDDNIQIIIIYENHAFLNGN